MSFKAYTHFLDRYRWPLALFFILLFALSIKVSSHLKLKSDFKELLPENFQSVQDLNRILDRVPGTASLIVAIESDDPQSSIRFGKALVEKLKVYPPTSIARIEENVNEVKKFFEEYRYLYMDLPDLETLYDRLASRIQREKLKHSGLYLSFETAEEEKEAFSTDDLEEKYKKKAGAYGETIDGYLFGENGRLMVIVIRPPGSATGIDFSRKLIGQLENTVKELNPTSFHPSLKVGFTGKFKRVLYEYQTLIDDIVSTALLCVVLVGLSVYIYYRRIRMVLLMAWAVFNGIAWTFALTYWHIGYLNTQTAFLGSIIVGNGINYSLILMARYLEERHKQKNPFSALETALSHTFTGTLASSLTTAVGFATLVLTQIRGFSQFGFIGALGMFLCWVATYSVLPVFLLISEKILPVFRSTHSFKERFSIMKPWAKWVSQHASTIVRGGIICTMMTVPVLIYYIPRSLEYDFSKLRVQTKQKEMMEEAALNERVKKIFGGSLAPAVLLVDKPEQAEGLCREIVRKNEQDPPEKRVIDTCKTVFSYVPSDQNEKNEVLTRIRALIENNTLNFLNAEQKQKMEEFKSGFVSKALSLEQVPEDVKRNFREKNGVLGNIVYVYPTDRAPLWNGKNLVHFSDLIRRNTLPSGETITASGDSVIFADLLNAVIKDGPKATLYSFVGVCLVILIIFRQWRAFRIIIGTLSCGVLWMGGLMPLLGIKINFFNFIAIPTTFGIGVDYGVNMYQRYMLEGKGSMPSVIGTTGGAVLLCSLTTIIGYFTLVIAQNQALVSFGWIGILGELTCLGAALIFIPAYLILKDKE